MVVGASGDHFEVRGIPLTPVDDSGTWNPFQVAAITVRDGSGAIVAETRTTVPTSDEIDCASCHAQDGAGTMSIAGGGANVFANILAEHDARSGTSLATSTPVLCASCHGSPRSAPAIRGRRASTFPMSCTRSLDDRATCYSCHPGTVTQCSRSRAHMGMDGDCTTCHGELSQVGGSIASGTRTPWARSPSA